MQWVCLMAAVLLCASANAAKSAEKLKRAAESLRELRKYCMESEKKKLGSTADSKWNGHIGKTWTTDDPCPKSGHPWTGVRCDTDFEEVQKLHLLGYDLYCDFTGFDAAAKGKFDPASLSGLTELELSYNKFVGPLPQLFADLTALDTLELSGNQFSGDISKLKFKSNTLQILALSGNKFTGEIPDLRGKPHLSEIDLTGNKFTGKIADHLSNVPLLQILNLGDNTFAGPLPKFKGVERLSRLNLQGNSFTGTIPSTLGELGSAGNGVLGLNLKGNKLRGPIPANILNLTSLRSLDVSGNQLTGFVPRLHTLPHLKAKAVHLDGNDFDCPIPQSFKTDTLYDSASCTCKAGSTGVAHADFDGAKWAAKRGDCRDGDGALTDACLKSSRFACKACPTGQFSATKWAAKCEPCAKGHAATHKRSSKCTACKLGDYSDGPGLPQCKACPEGKYSDARAATDCKLCAAGFKGDKLEATKCTACAKGSYQPLHAKTTCVVALKGSFATDCTKKEVGKGVPHLACRATKKCPKGKFSKADGSFACELCAAGRFASGEGTVTCAACDTGKFSSAGASECDQCLAGQFEKSEGSRACSPCAAGRWSGASAKACTDCAPGSLSAGGASKCDLCPFGRFAPKAGLAHEWATFGKPRTVCTRTGVHIAASKEKCQAKAETGLVEFFQHALEEGHKVPFEGDCAAAGRDKSDEHKQQLLDFLKACSGAIGVGVTCVDVLCDSPSAGKHTLGIRGSPANVAEALKALKTKKLSVPADKHRTSATVLTVKAGADTLTNTTHLCAVAASCDKALPAPEQDWFIYHLQRCQRCPAGEFADKRGAAACKACPAYALTNGSIYVGQAVCTYCPDGETANAQSNACTKCPEGRFSTGGVPCAECPAGEYSKEGASECSACGTFTYVVADGDAHTVCNAILTSEQAIYVSVAMVAVVVLALVLSVVGIIVYYQRRAAELKQSDWLFVVDDQGLGHWYNDATDEVVYVAPDGVGPPAKAWVRVLNSDREEVGFYNTESGDIICQMLKGVECNVDVKLKDSPHAAMQNNRLIWESLYQGSKGVALFDGWEGRYDGLTGSIFYIDQTIREDQPMEFYWKPIKRGIKPKQLWHQLWCPKGTVLCYWNIVTHDIATRDDDAFSETEDYPHIELQPTFLRGVPDRKKMQGSVGKCWLVLLNDSKMMARKFGWEWRYWQPNGKSLLWFYYNQRFQRFQWSRPQEWAAMQFVRFGQGPQAQFFNCEATPNEEDRLSSSHVPAKECKPDDVAPSNAIDYEIVTGNPDILPELMDERQPLYIPCNQEDTYGGYSSDEGDHY